MNILVRQGCSQWQLGSAVGGQTTCYTYDPAGQLKKVTPPDASWVGYDDARRQLAVYDNNGTRTEYLLGNASNRTSETTKYPNGALKRQLSRSIDALGRFQKTTGRECGLNTQSIASSCVKMLHWCLLLLAGFCPTHGLAGYVYMEPRMLGYNPGGSAGLVYFESVQEANNAMLGEQVAAQAQNPCPYRFFSPGPSPYGPNSFDVNGIRSSWGMYMTSVTQISNGSAGFTCREGDTRWVAWSMIHLQCPVGSVYGYSWLNQNQSLGFCSIYYPDQEPCPTCQTPNPVLITRGEKILPQTDYLGPSGLDYTRTFRGKHGRFISNHENPLFDHSGTGPLKGCLPMVYMHPQQTGSIPREYCFPYMAIGQQEYGYLDAMGRYIKFTGTPESPTSTPDVIDRLVQVTDAQGAKTWVIRRGNNTLEIYGNGARLEKRVAHDGHTYTTTYGTGTRTEAEDRSGRSIQLSYGPRGTVDHLIDPAGSVYDYSYDSNFNLTSVTYPPEPSGSRPSKTYHYGSNYNNGYRTLYSLTGISDEFDHRYSTFTYDSQGRVTSTRLHAGSGVDVNQYGLNYSSVYQPAVTDPLGNVRTYSFAPVRNYDVIKSVSQPGGAGSAAATRTATYDDQRNATSRDNFNGKRVCYGYDLSRNLETVRVEGLNAGASCAVTAANATLPAGGRKVSTQWHPAWRLETKIAEPGKITTLVYNGQPDPFNGNAVASCAPASARLPDGTPIAVVCKRVEQATTDANGALGFSAALQTTVPARTQSWTYNQYGQVLSEDGPRTNVSDITTYTYYGDTTADHMPGDLQSVTDAVGRVTQYSKYNRHGQLIESTDPNGVVTTNTYDLRMRLLSTTVAGQTTRYEYDPVGQLKKVTLPDASWVGYDYDGAHRQTAVYDNKGNRIDYVLDNAGNRTGENTKDPSGALKRQLARSIDALGRVQQTTGRE